MALVLDANLLVALASGEPAGALCERRLDEWLAAGEELHAPALVWYEVASGLRKAILRGDLAPAGLGRAVAIAESVPLVLHPRADLVRVIELAGELSRRSVYDAVYVALAEELGADLASLDGPLYRNARARGLAVILIGPEGAAGGQDPGERRGA
jgi:predicted nucleic acid-binding protein